MDQDSLTPSPSSKTDSIALILTACIISALLIYLVYLRSFVFGSELGNWVDRYLSSVPAFPKWIPLIVLLSIGLLVFLGGKFIHSYERITLFVLFLFAVFIQSLIRMIYPFSLGSVVQSDGANSFYTPAMSYSGVEILSKFIDLAPSFPLHAKANMPGKILLFELLKLFTSSPEMMGYLIIFLSSLGTLLLYGICKRLFQNRLIAFYAATLYILLPGKLFFLPILNTITPVLMLLCFYLFVVYLENKKFWVAWLLGLSGYFLILFEPSPLITGVVLIGILIRAIRDGRFSRKDLVQLFINTSFAFLVVYIFFYIFFSFNLFQSFLYVLKDARNFNVAYERGYLIWATVNNKDFFYGVGIPVIIVFIYMTAHILVETKTLKSVGEWPLENIFVISLLVTYFILLFLGINRGEVIRLWVYLAVLFQVPASIFIAKIEKGEFLFFLVASILAIQTMVTLHRVALSCLDHVPLNPSPTNSDMLPIRVSQENRRIQA